MRSVLFGSWIMVSIIAFAQTYPDQGGAQIDKPFVRKITGAVCFTGRGKIQGNAFFNFPTQDSKVLSFTIGPGAHGQEKNDAFTGPGAYSNIGIFIQPKYGDSLFGYGQVVVNDDDHSGTFIFKRSGSEDDDDDDDDNVASGTWDCGGKVAH